MYVNRLTSPEDLRSFQHMYRSISGHAVELPYLLNSQLIVFSAEPTGPWLAGYCIHDGLCRYLEPFPDTERTEILASAPAVPDQVAEIGCFFFTESLPKQTRLRISVSALMSALQTGRVGVVVGSVVPEFGRKLQSICPLTLYRGRVDDYETGLICYGSRQQVARNLIAQATKRGTAILLRNLRLYLTQITQLVRKN